MKVLRLILPPSKGHTAAKPPSHTDNNIVQIAVSANANAEEQRVGKYKQLKHLHFLPWAVFRKDQISDEMKNHANQIRYEAFIQGFVYYFEKFASSHVNDDRGIYFDWGELFGNMGLTIFMQPLYEPDKCPYRVDGAKFEIYPNPTSTTDPQQPPQPPPPSRDENT